MPEGIPMIPNLLGLYIELATSVLDGSDNVGME